MASYKHGVYVSEIPTSIVPPVNVDAGIPMIVGTAPIGMADETNINKPVLCYTYAEAVAAFGFVPAELDKTSGLKKFGYSISEAIYSQFALYGVAPIIIVNVLDPAKHRKDSSVTKVTLSSVTATCTVEETGIILSSVTLANGETTYTRGADFELGFDDDGCLVISSIPDADGDYKTPLATELTFSASRTDPSKVTAAEIIGGVDTNGVKTGWELIDDIFPRFRVVPGTLIAPGYSSDPEVAAIMSAKASDINNLFKAVSIVDIPDSEVTQYSAAPSWKENHNIASTHQIACWPGVALAGTYYHLSSQLAPLMAQVDGNNDDVPYVSPSNQSLQCDQTVLESGKEVWLNNETSAYLNSQGIVTAQNFIGGWKLWGNRTACYPANTDAKDAFICIRRMFNWLGNTLVQTYWSSVDMPINKRSIERVVDSVNIWLNGLTARQYILGGRVEFRSDENSTTDLLDGHITFHCYVTPPTPARRIDFKLEYDVDYFSALFA